MSSRSSKFCLGTDLIENSWDALYECQALTPWEMLPPYDLQEFLQRHCVGIEQVGTILSIGCGRGRRDVIALSGIPELNRKSLAYTGIDISAIAVKQANELFAALSAGDAMAGTSKFLKNANSTRLPQLLVRYQLVHTDVIKYLEIGKKYDAIIDWMCLHDLDVRLRRTYADLIKNSGAKYYILKTFSKEGSSIKDLGYVGEGIKKAQLSESEVCEMFGPEFEIVAFQQDKEELNPVPPPPDQIIAAKRAYLMRRIV
jgi:hypothetical protein